MFKFLKKIFGGFMFIIFHGLQIFGICIAIVLVSKLVSDFLEGGFKLLLKDDIGILIFTPIWIYIIWYNYKDYYANPE